MKDRSERFEARIAQMLRDRPPPGDAPGACADANLLVAWAGDRIAPEARATLEVHLARCDACRDLAIAAAREATVARPILRLPRWTALAAAAAAAIVLAVFLSGRDPDPGDPLLASARRVAAARPDLFPAGLSPLTPAELVVPPPPARRGGRQLTLREPCENVLGTRPSFHWSCSPATALRLTLLDANVRAAWERVVPDPGRSQSFAFPAEEKELAPGAWSWELAMDGPWGSVTESRAFRVPSPQEREAFEARRRAVIDRSDAAVRDLLLAHLALREGYPGEAAAPARAAARARPEDALTRATLESVLRRLGAREGD
jgi:hypothetical protein